MTQKEQNRYSNSSSGGGGGGGGGSCGGTGGGSSRSSKKLKQKKVPQRGLGVAQLEKIRLEEEQNKDAFSKLDTNFQPNPMISPSDSSPCLAVQCTNFMPTLSTGLPPAPPNDLSSSDSIFNPEPFIPPIDVTHYNLVPSSGESEIGWQRHGNWHKLWNGEYNLDVKNHKLNYYDGSAFRSGVGLPYESSNPLWPLPGIMPRSEQFQQSSFSSMVNVPSGTSSSSLFDFKIEPPSNQSYRGNNYTHLWPEDEKMVGLKRSFPFSIDDAPGPSFNFRFPPAFTSAVTRIDDIASCSNDGTSIIEPPNPDFREGPSSSNGMLVPLTKKIIKEHGVLNGDFLTLAPPKPKHPSSYLSLHCQELPDFDALPYQGIDDEPVKWPELGQLFKPPFFSFFPSANAQNGQAAAAISSNNGKIVESIDLSLKL